MDPEIDFRELFARFDTLPAEDLTADSAPAAVAQPPALHRRRRPSTDRLLHRDLPDHRLLRRDRT
jgi:hypothetical protein